MLRKLFLAVLLGLFAWAVVFLIRFKPEPKIKLDEPLFLKDVKELGSENEFAFDLYAKLKEKDGNLFFSPFSISSSLTMTYAGTDGETKSEMAKVLHLDGLDASIHSKQGELIRNLNLFNNPEITQISIANRLWAQKDFQFLSFFTNTLSSNYNAGLEKVDFRNESDATRTKINDWTAQSTRGKIIDLIPPGTITPDTKVILTNAIYFKAIWWRAFFPEQTREGSFFLADGSKVKCQMMKMDSSGMKSSVGEYDVKKDDGFRILELPFKNNHFSMLIVLPVAKDGLSAVEKKLNVSFLNQCLKDIRGREVDIMFPKFQFVQEFDLVENLRAIGMKSAFSDGSNGPSANFSKIANQPLKIDAIRHKTIISVDENGTEAAGSTAQMMGAFGEGDPPINFVANHPFLFLIRDNHSGTILFLGRVADPSEKALASTTSDLR
jgi:serine protease inhibitor